METIKVFWKDKFNGRAVVINAADFDPAIHQVGKPWVVGGQDAGAAEEPNPLLVLNSTSDQAPKPKGRKKTEE